MPIEYNNSTPLLPKCAVRESIERLFYKIFFILKKQNSFILLILCNTHDNRASDRSVRSEEKENS
jgi:hypothetical protein